MFELSAQNLMDKEVHQLVMLLAEDIGLNLDHPPCALNSLLPIDTATLSRRC